MTLWNFDCPLCGECMRIPQQEGERLTFHARSIGETCRHWVEPTEGVTTT